MASTRSRTTPCATFDLATVLRFADLALDALGAAREEIDALNVYPVPDGDTGTNMYLTFEAARERAARGAGGRPAGPTGAVALAAFARGAAARRPRQLRA